MKKYLIDYEMSGTLVVESSNPQAAAARGNAVLRAVAKGLSEEQADETECRVGAPIDLEAKMQRPGRGWDGEETETDQANDSRPQCQILAFGAGDRSRRNPAT